MKSKKRYILILEPYYGGSHKQFLTGLQASIEAKFIFLTLPARKWKMRMQLSAFWFAEQIQRILSDYPSIDCVLCSTFVDVAVLRSQLSLIHEWVPATPILTYFHENQFVYPSQIAVQNNHQFTAINFTTAMASDRICFNSQYNYKTFLDGVATLLKKASDMKLNECVSSLQEKSTVIYPGIDFSSIDKCIRLTDEKYDIPTIVWNHRWEHDKGPDYFFSVLYKVKERGHRFRLIVLGESFRSKPTCFEEAQQRLKDEIIHFGYAESNEEYANLMSMADITVSTATHEFYGISVLEAVRAGNYPILPKRLSYPELFPDKYLYDDGELEGKLTKAITDKVALKPGEEKKLTSFAGWNTLTERYQDWLFKSQD